ncbi:MAG TPA: hypothetical protein VK974_07835 [Methylophilaceae bacterium]|nr:hypothetical protein [Methylophilaceae bacterium]
MSAKFKPLTCRLGWHDWAIETRGMQIKGIVYPIRFRTCRQCHEVQREVFDEDNQSAGWTTDNS